MQRNFDAAEEELTAMLARSPDDGPLHLAAGQFYESRSLVDDAERLYRAVIERHGRDAPGLSARATASPRFACAPNRVRRRAAAHRARFSRKIRATTTRWCCAPSLALAEGQTLDAITDLRSVLRDQPDSAPLLRTLAYAHSQNNEPDLARENYRRAIEVDPANTQARLEYADYLIRRGENEEARPLLDAVLNAEPQNLTALELQFRVLGALGDAAGATQVAREIVAARPEAPLGYYLEGLDVRIGRRHDGRARELRARARKGAARRRAARRASPRARDVRIAATRRASGSSASSRSTPITPSP